MKIVLSAALSLFLAFSTLATAAEPASEAKADSAAAQAGSRPNVLFLFADDQSYETLGLVGRTDIDTPNLDRLARRGTRFTRAYNMGSWSGAVCVASRTMLLTGRSVWDAHRVYDETDAERKAGNLWPQLLGKVGYRTYFTGKWHVKADVAKAFDVTRHVRGGMPGTVPSAYDRPRAGAPDAWSPYDRSLGGFWEGGKHWSEVAADDAIDYLREADGTEAPFFMYVAFNAPHDPRQSPQEYVDRYPPDRIDVPENFLAEYPHALAIGCAPTLRDENLAPFPRTEHAVKVHRGEYYALIEHLDAQIGRILDALEESGQAEKTWIFFTADHGLACGHHGLMGKQNLYEHSTRVPFLVAGPGVPPGQTRDRPIYLQDAMATTLALAGAEKPEHVYFNSLLPLIDDPHARSPYDAVYGAYLGLQRSITVDGFKLIVYPEASVVRLYRLDADPEEMHDLADDPGQAQRRDDLLRRLIELQAKLGDDVDLSAFKTR